MDARTLTHTLKGRWYGRYGSAPCPVCQPEQRKGQNALTLADGDTGLLAHCKKSSCGFRDILGAAHVAPGTLTPDPIRAAKAEADRKAEAKRREQQAWRLWQEAVPIRGTLAETYLREARGITCALPDKLRYQADCWHPTATRHPAMIALVEGGDTFAVHRTYLRADGSGKADIDPPRAMLGAVAGGAVRLTDEGGPLVVAEGIETALSLASGLLRRPATIWATLSTSGMRSLKLPVETGRVTVATDSDDKDGAGHAAGWTVSTLPAPNGCDWNDILTMKGCKP